MEQTKKEMAKYDTLQKIVDQLEMTEYQSKDGMHFLANNVAFLKLKNLAKETNEI